MVIIEYQICMHSRKTEILVSIRRPTINTNIHLENQLIAQISSFKYFGRLLKAERSNLQEIKPRIG